MYKPLPKDIWNYIFEFFPKKNNKDRLKDYCLYKFIC